MKEIEIITQLLHQLQQQQFDASIPKTFSWKTDHEFVEKNGEDRQVTRELR
jgi:hypothetical protein